MNGYGGKERRLTSISDEQLEAIAERAAEKALEKIYSDVGQGVVKKLAFLVGVILISVFLWLAKSGKLVM